MVLKYLIYTDTGMNKIRTLVLYHVYCPTLNLRAQAALVAVDFQSW